MLNSTSTARGFRWNGQTYTVEYGWRNDNPYARCEPECAFLADQLVNRLRSDPVGPTLGGSPGACYFADDPRKGDR